MSVGISTCVVIYGAAIASATIMNRAPMAQPQLSLRTEFSMDSRSADVIVGRPVRGQR